jgi:hypothetical protein
MHCDCKANDDRLCQTAFLDESFTKVVSTLKTRRAESGHSLRVRDFSSQHGKADFQFGERVQSQRTTVKCPKQPMPQARRMVEKRVVQTFPAFACSSKGFKK